MQKRNSGAEALVGKINKIQFSKIEDKIDKFVDKAINKLESIENKEPRMQTMQDGKSNQIPRDACGSDLPHPDSRCSEVALRTIAHRNREDED